MSTSFDVFNVSEFTAKRVETIRQAFVTLSNELDNLCPNSADKTVAMRKLGEAFYWATTGVAKDESPCCKPNGACDSLGTPCAA